MLMPALKQCRGRLLFAIALGLGARWVFLPLPFLLRRLLRQDSAKLSAGALTPWGLTWPELALVGLLLLACLRLGLVWGQKVASERAAQTAIAFLRQRMMAHLMRLKLSYFDQRAAGKVVLRFVSDANAIKSFLGTTLVNLSADLPTILAIMVLLFFIQWQVALIACTGIPIALLIFRRLNPELRARTRLARKRQAELCNHLTQRLWTIEEIKANRAEEVEAARGGSLIDSVADANVRRARINGVLSGVTAGLFTAALALVVWLGGRLTMTGDLTVPDLVAFLLLCSFMQGPIRRCSASNAGFQRAQVALERIHAFMIRPLEPDAASPRLQLRVVGRQVKVSDLSFQYHRTAPWVFNGLNLKIEGPGLVVLEGPTGVGKSTLFALILRLRRPQAGSVAVDGVSLRRVSVASVRRQIGWLPQEVRLLPGTVAENVRYGCPDLSDAQVEEWLSRTMPVNGLETPRLSGANSVSEFGRNLSPVQRVQVGLARALATGPRVVLLDDPTAHMGLADEDALRELIGELRSETLIIAASSRRWLLAAADQRIDLALVDGTYPGNSGSVGDGVASSRI